MISEERMKEVESIVIRGGCCDDVGVGDVLDMIEAIRAGRPLCEKPVPDLEAVILAAQVVVHLTAEVDRLESATHESFDSLALTEAQDQLGKSVESLGRLAPNILATLASLLGRPL